MGEHTFPDMFIANPWEFIMHNPLTDIGWAAVDHDDLKITEGLPLEGFQTLLEGVMGFVSGDNNTDFRV